MADFTNINGVYAKDTELRDGINALRNKVINSTIQPLTITKNGTYTSDPLNNVYGYSPITVDVQEEPWQPLQDGYSNFWFELTDDTLSPWLNFSAKNNDAVIDWGDGSGEQALDTLTPTHTYAKAGKYVVKVKGVTGIAQQNVAPYPKNSLKMIRNVELNNEVVSLATAVFSRCVELQNLVIHGAVSAISQYGLYYCTALESVQIPSGVTAVSNNAFAFAMNIQSISLPQTLETIGNSGFANAAGLASITIPSAVTSIGQNAFSTCSSLQTVHMQGTTPPTLGGNAFYGLPSDWLCYVPVGYGDTYKAASGWSTYADHILEEGQTPNRLMMAKFNSDNTDEDEMR